MQETTFTPDEIARDDVLQYFSYSHLPAALATHSRPFAEHARTIIDTMPRCPERTVALRKLLEAKDAAVRASMWKPTPAGAAQPNPPQG